MSATRAAGAAGAPSAGDAGRAAMAPPSVLWLNNALQVLSNAAWYSAAPFIPLYLAAQGASVAVVGTIVGVSGVAPLLVSIHAGALVDERGPIVVAKASVILFAAAGAILTVLHRLWAVAVAYALMGIGNIGFAIAPQAIVAAASTDATRVRNYGYYALWNSAGAVVGPVIGGLAAGHFGYTAAFAPVWLLMLPAFGVTASLRGVPAAARARVSLATAHTVIGAIVRQRGVGAILFLSSMMVCAQTLQQSFYPLYLHKVGLPDTLIGLVVAAVSLSSMLVRTLLAWGVAWLGYARLLLGATALAAIALGITPLLHQFWTLVVASGLLGASLGFTQPLTMSLLAECVAAEFWGIAFGVRQSVQRVSAIASPVVFGLVSVARGLESAFLAGALTLLGAVLIMARAAGYARRPAAGPPGQPPA